MVSTSSGLEPLLTRDEPDGAVTGVVLLLHGGTEHSAEPVDGRSASWRRMRAIQRNVTPPAHDRGIATWLLRYRVRGWNGTGAGPIADARWALAEIERAHPGVPIVILGHSMGARTAIHVADAPGVVGVVGLAPWWPPHSPVGALRGRHLRAAHGRADKITSARATRAFVAEAETVAASAEFTDMGRVGHYMLRRIPSWNTFATTATLDLLV